MVPRRVIQPTPPLGPSLLGTYPIQRPDDDTPREELMAAALQDPASRVLLIKDKKAPLTWSNGQADIAWQSVDDDLEIVALLGTASDGSPVLLGRTARPKTEAPQAGDPWPEESEAHAAGRTSASRWAGLREAAPVLPAEQSTWMSIGIALMNWHTASGFCPNCGSTTRSAAGGWARVCDAEEREIFPRTDPAVISAVVHTDSDGVDRLLLGHSAAWPEGRFSTFAGFVEAGESLEAAVAREIYEESGVEIAEAEYLGSQPWPFPRSLMLGFEARAVSPESARPDGAEITQVRWFTREELSESVRSGEIALPGSVSIAHHLITRWFGSPLPHADS